MVGMNIECRKSNDEGMTKHESPSLARNFSSSLFRHFLLCELPLLAIFFEDDGDSLSKNGVNQNGTRSSRPLNVENLVVLGVFEFCDQIALAAIDSAELLHNDRVIAVVGDDLLRHLAMLSLIRPEAQPAARTTADHQ